MKLLLKVSFLRSLPEVVTVDLLSLFARENPDEAATALIFLH
jgi:hypothetical protein